MFGLHVIAVVRGGRAASFHSFHENRTGSVILALIGRYARKMASQPKAANGRPVSMAASQAAC